MQCSTLLTSRLIATVLAALVCALALASSASAARVSIASPHDGATLSRTATFKPRLAKSLKQRVKRVEVWLGSARIAVDGRAPFKPRVDTTALADGEYTFTLRAVAREASVAAARSFTRRVSAVISNASRSKGSKPKPSGSSKETPAPTVPEPTPDPRLGGITDGDPSDNWRMVFSDEFDGSSLDATKWSPQRNDWTSKGINDFGQPWKKGGFPYNILEGAWYMPENSTVAGGALKQTVRKLATPLETQHWGTYKYSTGMVNTKDRFDFTYGYVESRIRVPSCSGCWPAFWMLPAKDGWPPEIDIFEYFDTAKLKFPYFSTHMAGSGGAIESNTQPFGNTANNYVDSWHTYGLLWDANSVQIFMDGIPGPKYTGSAVPRESMYLILQQAIGRDYATEDGATMETDYVRVYQQQ